MVKTYADRYYSILHLLNNVSIIRAEIYDGTSWLGKEIQLIQVFYKENKGRVSFPISDMNPSIVNEIIDTVIPYLS